MLRIAVKVRSRVRYTNIMAAPSYCVSNSLLLFLTTKLSRKQDTAFKNRPCNKQTDQNQTIILLQQIICCIILFQISLRLRQSARLITIDRDTHANFKTDIHWNCSLAEVGLKHLMSGNGEEIQPASVSGSGIFLESWTN